MLHKDISETHGMAESARTVEKKQAFSTRLVGMWLSAASSQCGVYLAFSSKVEHVRILWPTNSTPKYKPWINACLSTPGITWKDIHRGAVHSGQNWDTPTCPAMGEQMNKFPLRSTTWQSKHRNYSHNTSQCGWRSEIEYPTRNVLLHKREILSIKLKATKNKYTHMQ